MAAGQGFKTFTTGEVLTAGDVNGYLMQGINVFADAAARDAAITAPAEGQFAYTRDNNSLWYYTGSAWAASGATGDIEGVTATSPLTGGGTSGTVTVGIQEASTSQRGSVQLSDSTSTTSSVLASTPTAVKSAYDLAAAAIPKSTVTTNGDVIYATGSSAVTRLGIGSTGQVLTVAGGVPTWASAGSSGAMTQIADTTLSSAAADITFSSIPNTYNHLKLVISGASSSGAWNGAGFNIQINADSGANYSFSTVSKYAGPGATMTLEGQNSQTQIELGNIWCGQAQANSISSIEMTFFNYKGTTLQKGMVFIGGSWTDAPGFGSGWGRWKSTSAITSIKLYSGAGNFMTGTRATLYGWT